MAGHNESALPPRTAMFPKESISDTEQLISVIEETAAGNVVSQPATLPGLLPNLTASQIAILRMLAQGYTVAEIANQRDRSSSAIEKSITSIYKRLKLADNRSLSPRTLAIRTYIEQLGLPSRKEDILSE